MKPKILLLVFAGLVLVHVINGQEKSTQPARHKDRTSEPSQPPPETSPQAVNVINQQTAATQENRAQEYPKSYLSRLFSPENIPNIGLLLAGIVGIIVAIRTLYILRAQTAATRQAAEAAIAANEAAISKDRARLQIIAGGVSLQTGQTIGITYYLNNIGPTTAFLEEGGINLVKGTEQIVVDYSKCAKLPFVGSILANSRTANEGFILIALPAPLNVSEVLEFRNGKAFIHCYGYVKYRDVFDRPREVRLHLRWYMSFGGVIPGQITEGWSTVGPAEENSDK